MDGSATASSAATIDHVREAADAFARLGEGSRKRHGYAPAPRLAVATAGSVESKCRTSRYGLIEGRAGVACMACTNS